MFPVKLMFPPGLGFLHALPDPSCLERDEGMEAAIGLELQQNSRAVGVGPEEGHKDDPRAGAPLL